MTSWMSEDIVKIGDAEELDVASRRPDGTLRSFVTIWVVRSGDDHVGTVVSAESATTTLRLVPRSASRTGGKVGRSPALMAPVLSGENWTLNCVSLARSPTLQSTALGGRCIGSK